MFARARARLTESLRNNYALSLRLYSSLAALVIQRQRWPARLLVVVAVVAAKCE